MLNFAEDNGSIRSCSDEELVPFACEGSERCMNELLQRMDGVIKRSIRLYIDKNLESDDMEQEAKIAFLNAVRTYEREKGSSFKTYTAVCVNNRLLNFIKSKSSGKMVTRADFTHIDDESENSVSQNGDDDPEALFISREQSRLLGEMIKDVLSSLEYDVFRCLVDGLKYEEIADKLGITTKSVDNAVQRLRKKLRNILE